ncbi:glutathione S-transferase T3-like [Beta vulgaris subsp. vulgaris]|uniref:glutathione S-transferase T3-like n=1 Tax=Beta vulgaris subsp. vulgaris TaxID=3555 RepID=UPI002036C39D|nr:glutathione S-transferase T3-like [Beta vulgaris subsp. vulgaris]
MDSNYPNYVPNPGRRRRNRLTNSQQNTNQNPINYQQNLNNYPQNPTNYPQNPHNYQQNPPNYPQNSHNYQQNPPNYPQNSTQNYSQNDPQNYRQHQQNYQYNSTLESSHNPQNYPQNQDYDDDRDDEEDEDDDEFEVPCTQQTFTQLLSEPTQFQPTPQPTPRPTQEPIVNEKKIWWKAEKAALVSAFMNTSIYNIVGTQQKKGAFWGRVMEKFEAAREANPHEIQFRNIGSMKGQWFRMSEAVQKWCGCYDKAEVRKRSGQNDDDVISETHKIFESTGGKFHFYDEWILMRKFDKYRSILSNPGYKITHGRPSNTPQMSNSVGSGSSGKRTRSEDGGSTPTTPTSGDVPDDHSPRPEGNKKAKARLKGKSQTSEAIEAFSSFGDRLQLYGERKGLDIDLQHEKLRFLKQKEARKQRQLELEEISRQRQTELEEKNIKMQQYQVNWQMLQSLISKENRLPWEDEMINNLQIYFNNFGAL